MKHYVVVLFLLTACAASKKNAVQPSSESGVLVPVHVQRDRSLVRRATCELSKKPEECADGDLPNALADGARAGILGGNSIATTSDIVIRAIAGVLEKRAKAEFRVFILTRLRKKLCDAEYVDWVPNTCAYLGKAEDDLSFPLALGAGFRTAVVQDAVELPARVVSKRLSSGDANKLLARLGIEAALVLLRERDPVYWGTLMKELGDAKKKHFTCSDKECESVRPVLHVVGQIVEAARTKSWGEAWGVKPDTARRAIKDFIASLPADIVSDTVTDSAVDAIGQSARAVIIALEKLEEELAKPPGPGPHAREEKLRAVLRATSQVLSASIDLARSATAITNEEHATRVATIIDALVTCRDLALVLSEANLARVITLVATKTQAAQAHIPGPVLRVASFAVDLASAKDSDEAEAVIENVAAPVGAWRGKLDTTRFSLSGFVGASLSTDRANRDDVALTTNTAAPVAAAGLDINFVPNRYVRPGLFLSVIDVGNLMSYSWHTEKESNTAMTTDYEVSQTTPIGFAQVFSPGVFFRLGLGDWPLVVGAGVSTVPEAREVSATMGTETTTEDVRAVRYSLFLAIDVTLFPF